LQIIVAPDPRLLKKAEPVELDELPELRAIAAEMAEMMYQTMGCGLAAPQIGLTKQLIVVDPEWGIPDEETGVEAPRNPRFLINPVIKRLWGEKALMDEGCLSVPGITVPVERYEFAEIEAHDLNGNLQTFVAEDFAARVLQHEIDHLNGMTVFERLDPIKRIDALHEYEVALAAGAQPGDTSIPSVNGTAANRSVENRSVENRSAAKRA
jgi:peptide deformylase